MKIDDVSARAVLDSNGMPAIEISLRANGCSAHAIAPRGSTVGQFEAVMLEDETESGTFAAVQPALEVTSDLLRPALLGQTFEHAAEIDRIICEIDGSATKSLIGGNVAVAASAAAAKLGAQLCKVQLFEYLRATRPERCPRPMFNIIDGAHVPGCGIAGIEFLFLPGRDEPVRRALEQGIALRAAVKERLLEQGLLPADGPQGAFAVKHQDIRAPLRELCAAMADCRNIPDRAKLGLDLAATDFHGIDGYTYPWANGRNGNPASATQLARTYDAILEQFPIAYLEDAFAETDTQPWADLVARWPHLMIVGDDLFASSKSRIEQGARAQLANAVLIKPNQVGTLSEALEAMKAAQGLGFEVIVSQRSGENDDDVITHLAVAGEAAYLKAGGLSRMDRIIKFNTLLGISEQLEK